MNQSGEHGTLFTTGLQQFKPSSLWFTTGSNHAQGQNTHLSLEQSQEHKGDKKQDEKQPERRPGAGGSLQSTSLTLLLAHFRQMIGDYLQRGGHNSAFLLSLSPCKTTPLLYFLGLFHLKQTSQAPLIDIPEANTMRQVRLPVNKHRSSLPAWSTQLLIATTTATVKEIHPQELITA